MIVIKPTPETYPKQENAKNHNQEHPWLPHPLSVTKTESFMTLTPGKRPRVGCPSSLPRGSSIFRTWIRKNRESPVGRMKKALKIKFKKTYNFSIMRIIFADYYI
jgi:hypothetical protein